jgi:limonene-1,2-epoxide hydrolase
MLQQGNIDLYNRPQVKNPDGTISTVRSMSIDIGGKSYLIPTVAADGSGVLTDQQAIDQFKQTGQHLGIFDNHDDADAYSDTLHKQQDQLYNNNLQGQQ